MVLKHIQVVLKYFQSTLGNCNVVFLRYMDVSVPHLIAEQVRWCVHFCHKCSVSVAEIMEFELDSQLFLDFP